MKPLLFLLLPALASAAVWPESLGAYHRTSATAPALTDRGLWIEYGLKDSETAAYENGKDKFTATVYHLGVFRPSGKSQSGCPDANDLAGLIRNPAAARQLLVD